MGDVDWAAYAEHAVGRSKGLAEQVIQTFRRITLDCEPRLGPATDAAAIRWVAPNAIRLLAVHETPQLRRIPRVTAQQAIGAELHHLAAIGPCPAGSRGDG